MDSKSTPKLMPKRTPKGDPKLSRNLHKNSTPKLMSKMNPKIDHKAGPKMKSKLDIQNVPLKLTPKWTSKSTPKRVPKIDPKMYPKMDPKMHPQTTIGPGGHFRLPGQVPQNPSRMAISTGFQPSLGHLLEIWSRWSFSASWPGAPKVDPQNGSRNGYQK